jgi:predicted TIM-barrel fold metal-dependent hydrolase
MGERLPRIDACAFISPLALQQAEWMNRIPLLPLLDEGFARLTKKLHWQPYRTSDLLSSLDEASMDWCFLATKDCPKSMEQILSLSSQITRFKPILQVSLPKGSVSPSKETTKDWAQGLKKRGFRGFMCPLGVFQHMLGRSFYRELLHQASILKMPLFVTTEDVQYIGQKEQDSFKAWVKSFPRVQFVLCSQKHQPWSSRLKLLDEAPNVFLSTAGASSQELIQASSQLGPERLIFASQWPLQSPSIAMQQLQLAARHFNASWLDQVVSHNAFKLLP